MSTIRFSQVVKKSGKPGVYLLLSRDDPEFKKALKAHRIMTLRAEGTKTEHGQVGYDEKRRGQLLLFPRSLKPFEKSRVVGIQYELFSGEKEKPASSSKAASKKKPLRKSKSAPSPKMRTGKEEPPKGKVIPFPKPSELDAEDEDESIQEIKGSVLQAMKQLEKGNSVAAYNLLKRIVE